MRERRFLVPEVGSGGDVEIAGSEAHHLLHVLRLRPGDDVTVFDGRGRQFLARLVQCGRVKAVARTLAPLPSLESTLELTLAVSLPKRERFELAIEKATELGVSRIIPLVTERTSLSNARRSRREPDRWRRIATEASKQCGRAAIPEVDAPATLDRVLRFDASVKLLLTHDGDPLPPRPDDGRCLVVVGPEGGWTPEEVRLARRAGFHVLGLGPRTLRTETAAVAATFLLQWSWGDCAILPRL